MVIGTYWVALNPNPEPTFLFFICIGVTLNCRMLWQVLCAELNWFRQGTTAILFSCLTLRCMRVWCPIFTPSKITFSLRAFLRSVNSNDFLKQAIRTSLDIWTVEFIPLLILIFLLFLSSDINECSEGKHDCKLNQMCMNTYGSFYCVCPRGYSAKTAQSPCQGESYKWWFQLVWLFTRFLSKLREFWNSLILCWTATATRGVLGFHPQTRL